MMLDALRQIPLFACLNDEQLAWIAGQCSAVELKVGETLFAEGDPSVNFYVLLEGELQVTKQIGGLETVLTTHQAGAFSGEIPLLTGSAYVATLRALQASRLIKMSADSFQQMLVVCSPITTIMLPIMAWRIQATQEFTLQNEKLAALGKLSAGLAHELNNPASAGHRAAIQLRETFAELLSATPQFAGQLLAPTQLARLTAMQREALERAKTPPQLDTLAQSDQEDEMGAWLEAHGSAEGWRMAPTLVEAGLDICWLDEFAAQAGASSLPERLTWLDVALQSVSLMHTVEQSTARISELVKAVKAYTYMDQAPQQEVDIHQGLENTLTILGYKLKGIEVRREYDRGLPRITAYGSELNQVWTNLIDNAIDALDGKGQLWIRTRRELDRVVVEIADNGTGIPAEIQSRIFEPFFTTKGVGKGTGLGLDTTYRIVVGKHKGTITVSSQPGDTCFQVRLPVELEK